MTLPTGLLLIFLIGLLAGLRSFTPPAATAWGVRLGWLPLGTWFSWLGTTVATVIFTVLALAEIVNDKLPETPSRTAPPGLIARIVTAGFTGACLGSLGNQQSFILGAIVAIIGALAGTYGGHAARVGLVKALHSPDYVVAIIEDIIAVAGSLWVVSRF
jgi:uncharacterized membrane protein